MRFMVCGFVGNLPLMTPPSHWIEYKSHRDRAAQMTTKSSYHTGDALSVTTTRTSAGDVERLRRCVKETAMGYDIYWFTYDQPIEWRNRRRNLRSSWHIPGRCYHKPDATDIVVFKFPQHNDLGVDRCKVRRPPAEGTNPHPDYHFYMITDCIYRWVTVCQLLVMHTV